jgi:2-polyprenyl-3-methyl-5-hydroxy-6-metoxy-1,4-benzoquinol methylase
MEHDPPQRFTTSAWVYRLRMLAERLRFRKCASVHALPDIYHYWSNRYLRPKFEQFGATHPEAFFLQCLQRCRAEGDDRPLRFLSIGAGDCAIEVGLAAALAQQAGAPFVIECHDVNRRVLERGRKLADAQGVAAYVRPVLTDLNRWRPEGRYDAVLANQSLHHVVGLENLFDGVANSLSPRGLFVVSDMIGRNGHKRWPEALAIVEAFWNELPPSYRVDRQRGRQQRSYPDVDYSTRGFEGIRAQDILPLLVERFGFDAFIGFANAIDPFIDRSFGPNFSLDREWDRAFIDRVHARDEAAMDSGEIKPTHMLAALCAGRDGEGRFADGRSPRQSIRWPG